METVHWKQDYSSGVTEIDAQHRHFIGLINNVVNAQMSNYPKAMVDQLLMGLLNYTKFHFQSEETLMKLNKYENYDRHKKLHDQILEILNHKIVSYKRNQCTVDDLIGMLLEWFKIHTAQEDKAIGLSLSRES